jgi:hypothetical protein
MNEGNIAPAHRCSKGSRVPAPCFCDLRTRHSAKCHDDVGCSSERVNATLVFALWCSDKAFKLSPVMARQRPAPAVDICPRLAREDTVSTSAAGAPPCGIAARQKAPGAEPESPTLRSSALIRGLNGHSSAGIQN